MNFILFFLAAFALAALLTPPVKRLATHIGCMDIPRPPRNLHAKPTPKLGGLAIWLALVLVTSAYWYSGFPELTAIPGRFLIGILAGSAILMIGGILDDRYDLPPYVLWVFPALAATSVVLSGIGVGITAISNPFGEPISLAFNILSFPASAIFVWVWMVGMMFTTKFLDGIDGLAAGISVIAGLTLFFLSLSARINQPMTAMLAIIFCGALLGYLLYSFHPASVFLGEGGSTLIGFILGALSIVLGGKIMTALLVMGIPILDVAWVLTQRLWYGSSPFKGDRLHLHFRLLDLGFTQKQTVLILYACSAAFGFTAVFLQTWGKLVALLILGVVMVIFSAGLAIASRKKQKTGLV